MDRRMTSILERARMPRTRLQGSETFVAVATSSVLSFAYALIRLSGSLSTGFGPIDDHDLLAWIGNADRVPISHYLSTLFQQTEVGSFGTYARFRPAYYAVRVGEAVVFGNNPTLWYAASMVMYAATVSLLSIVVWMWIRWNLPDVSSVRKFVLACLLPALGVLLFGSLPAWVGVTGRLGPTELLAMVGVSLIALSGTILAGLGSGWWWAPGLVGAFLAAGAKENFAPAALVLVCIGFYRFSCTKRSRDVILGASCAVVPLVVTLALLHQVGANGGDVYGNSMGGTRLASTVSALTSVYVFYWLPVATLVVAATIAWASAVIRPTMRAVTLVGSLVTLSTAWLFFDSWIYRGVYELPRYWMVFDFLKVIGTFAAVTLALAVAMRRAARMWRVAGFTFLVGSVVLVLFQVLAAPKSIQAMRSEVKLNDEAVLMWQRDADIVVAAIKRANAHQVTLVPSGGVDFEPTIALAQLLHHQFENLKVFVAVNQPSSEQNAAAAPSGIASLVNGWTVPKVTPLTEWDPNARSVCAFLNGEPYATRECTSTSSFQVRARAM